MNPSQRSYRTERTRDQVFALHNQGLSQVKIAAQTGLHRQTVKQLLYEEGYDTSYNYKFMGALTEHQHNVLIGTLLGDGHIARGKENWSPQLALAHGPVQREYLIWKAAQLYPLFTSLEPREYKHKNGNVSYHMNSRRTPLLLKFYDLFYSRPDEERTKSVYKKKITQKLLDLVNDEVMAIWYCDDGSTLLRHEDFGRRDSMRLVVGAVTEEEYSLVLKMFTDKGYSPVLDHRKKVNAVVLRFNVEDSERLAKLLAPFVPQCMRYKLGRIVEPAGFFIRRQLRNVSFFDQIPPPEPVRADSNRKANHDTLVKIVDIEPTSKAMTLCFRGQPLERFVRWKDKK